MNLLEVFKNYCKSIQTNPGDYEGSNPEVELAHLESDFYGELVKFMTSGPVLAMVLEGRDVIRIMRKIAGATSPKEALPGTIRGDFAADVEHNLIHTSDSEENAKKEIAFFFSTMEIIK